MTHQSFICRISKPLSFSDVQIVLAVVGACAANALQAYNDYHGSGRHDTEALAAANAAFAAAYEKQLALVSGKGGGGGEGGSHDVTLAAVAGGAPHHAPQHGGGLGYFGIAHVPGADTPAVAAAKAQFFNLYNQQAALAAAAPDDNHSGGYAHNPGAYNPGGHGTGAYNPGGHDTGAYNPGAYNTGAYNPAIHGGGQYRPEHQFGSQHLPSGGHYSGAHHGAGPHGVVGDTPEVAAAKAQFFKVFEKQAAAVAAASPDDKYH
ncbi:spidroin-2-like [Macrobrachium rosenbergii]|uniref:spidroin-2-like n=1 Tax=Macrobrachium rosenbergii TaxID=79674 RepID=UPI0034D67EAD